MFAIDGGRKYAYDEHVCVGLHDLEVGLELSKTIQTEFEPTISSQPVISQVNLSLHLRNAFMDRFLGIEMILYHYYAMFDFGIDSELSLTWVGFIYLNLNWLT